MLDGKTGQMQFHIEKKPVILKSYNKYSGIINSFPNLKADETIKIPVDGLDKKQSTYMANGIKYAIDKVNKGKFKAGTAIQNGFIYIFKRG